MSPSARTPVDLSSNFRAPNSNGSGLAVGKAMGPERDIVFISTHLVTPPYERKFLVGSKIPNWMDSWGIVFCLMARNKKQNYLATPAL